MPLLMPLNAKETCARMREALGAKGRSMVFSVRGWGDDPPWGWLSDIAHMWRTPFKIARDPVTHSLWENARPDIDPVAARFPIQRREVVSGGRARDKQSRSEKSIQAFRHRRHWVQNCLCGISGEIPTMKSKRSP